MKRSADVVIIGGGIVGVSMAYYLTTLGVRNLLLLERHLLGEGSTIRSAGIVRGPFSTEINCQFGAESLRIYGQYEDEIGTPISYRQPGYLILLGSAQEQQVIRNIVDIQNQAGLNSRLISPADVQDLAPWMKTEDLTGAIYTPDGGYASQHEVVMGFARRARENGAELCQGVSCTGFLVENGRVVGVQTPEGTVTAGTVVLTAGVWSRDLCATIGIDLPVFPSRSHIAMLKPSQPLPPDMPVLADFPGSYYTRPEVDQLLVGLTNPEETIDLRVDVDWEFVTRGLPHVVSRMPWTESAELGTVYAGSIEYTPDKHPVMGSVPEVGGLLVATGFSGHGFMHGPVAGKLMAEQIAFGQARTIDISPLDIRRFDQVPPAGLAPIREELSYQRKAIANYRRSPV